jgi:MerR family transcriptional regulator, light-induced transcriptional regulator
LTIGELARRTGVAVATLRMWEQRHGFPVARRLASGHRRYGEETVQDVQRVQRLRDSGVRLDLAVAQVRTRSDAPVASLYAELHRLRPALVPHRLKKTTLLALTRALEDECCARARRPWLFGAFQHETFYRQAESRWRDLARTAAGAWALAEFEEPRTDAQPVEVSLTSTTPMVREWSLVCWAADFPAALAAWELPGQDDVPDADRVFESLWTLEPEEVRDAARAGAEIVAGHGEDVATLLDELDTPVSPPAGLRHATDVFSRVLQHVDRLR